MNTSSMEKDAFQPSLDSSLLLTGMKHSGKSSHGKALAKAFGLPFIDLDDLILELYHDHGGKERDIRTFYRSEGKAQFMEYERLAAERVSAEKVAAIVSAGGGLADNRAAFDLFTGDSELPFIIIHLSVEEEILFERIHSGGIPPFLKERGDSREAASESFHQLYLRREAIYREYADITLPLPEESEKENRSMIITAISNYLRVPEREETR